MSKTAALFVLLLAVCSGLIASATVMKYVREQTARAEDKTEKVSVLVASEEIPAGTTILAGQVEVSERESEIIPEKALKAETDAVGHVAKSTIYPGEVLLTDRVAEKGSPAGLPALIPEGYRAMTLRVDDTISVAGFVRPGHHVDVVTTVEPPNERDDTVSKVILQNIQVVATGREIEEKEDKKAKVVPTVTVLVTPEQAERLTLAATAGSIRLVLRNHHIDRAELRTPGVRLTNLIQDSGAPVYRPKPDTTPMPIRPTPKPVRVVEVYRGTQKSSLTFAD